MDTNEKTGDPKAVSLQIAEYRPTAAALAEVRSRLDGIVYHDLGSKRQMEAAKADRRLLVTMRTTLETKRKELKAPALERSRLIDAEAKDIEKQIRDLEEPIDLQIKAEETRAESERLAKLEAERVRVEAINTKIAAFREVPGSVVGWPSMRIEAELNRMLATTVKKAEFEERTDEARDALEACQMRLSHLLNDSREREQAAERARQQEQELREAKERIARMEREAQEAREREERREREEQERASKAEEERVSRIRLRLLEIRSLGASIYTTLESFDKATFQLAEIASQPFDYAEFAERYEKEWKEATDCVYAKRDAFLREQQAEQGRAQAAEAERIERERQLAEARAQAEKAEAARKEAARRADAARREALGITDAAQALLSRVQREGHGQWPEAVDLGEVLAKKAKVA